MRKLNHICLPLLFLCAIQVLAGGIMPAIDAPAATEKEGNVQSAEQDVPASQQPPSPPGQPNGASRPDNSGGNDKRGGDTPPQDGAGAKKDTAASTKPAIEIASQAEIDDEGDVPDSLCNPRWKVQRTTPVTEEDLSRNATDLSMPENITQTPEYNDSTDEYTVGSKIGNSYIGVPITMTPEEFRSWSEELLRKNYFRSKNDEIYQEKEKDKWSFTDMHFDLGPAEKIFGPGGVRIKTQGTAELRMGVTLKNVDNPSLSERNRKTTTMNFEENINLSMNGKVGDKVDMNLNYNTDATFDYDAQNMKLTYEGKEDEIIKLVEAGNISFPSNSSLYSSASSLFGVRTDLQFGKLSLQAVVSQKKSSSQSVSSDGGTQTTDFELDVTEYEENRHFWLSKYFKDKYDDWMSNLPNILSGISISRVEVWVTNKTGTTTNCRDIVAFTDIGENTSVSNDMWTLSGQTVPCNAANTLYTSMVNTYSDARDIDQVSTVLETNAGLTGGEDFEKLESARLLTSSEYTLNEELGYISLKTTLQTDQVLAVAFEYTYGGVTYQVGEFAADISDNSQALFVKALKNTSNNPTQGNWDLMMKNVYHLASSIEETKFKLDVKYQSDSAGVYLSYIPESQVKSTPIIKLLGADRLDANGNANSNGYFDYVEGYTVTNGRVFFPKAEPFGSYMYEYLVGKGVDPTTAESYSYTELYDSTKTTAEQIAEKDKYILTGHFTGTLANVISLGSVNIPSGSVTVTAGGVTLTEGTDYSVDYSAGEVTILNQSIIDAGTTVNVSFESESDYGQMRKTMLGLNWQYDFSKELQLSGTIQHLSEQALTNKVTMGNEPLNNTLWGVNINWKKESQWLTNLLDKLPGLHLTAPSQITLKGEFAQLIAGQASGTQDNASYIDDFENTKNGIDVSEPTDWMISSVPSMFSESTDKTTVASGYNRALLAFYTIDPLFTRRSSSLTPSHIKSDLEQLSNHYVREVYVKELYPNRNQSSYSGTTSTLSILNLAYYPDERGPYNLNTDLTSEGHLNDPASKWGGMMRHLDTSDFETANISYIEFWLLDPFIYTNQQADAYEYGGDFYINLGEVSEDILKDGKKFYESGMPVDGTASYTTTQWGRIPTQSTTTYAFATTDGSRDLQDVGLNGLTDDEEQTFDAYLTFINAVQGTVTGEALDSILNDPANDDYHYFRGTDFDDIEAPILQRYKRINMPQGNSPDSDSRDESYDTSYKTTPDCEDINEDYTLNEYEKYYQYHVSIRPEDLVVGQNYIEDKREASVSLRNGTTETVTWYQFRIPVDDYETKVGSISDFSSIRFMRMFLTGFEKPIVLRFGSLDLVRGEWRLYEQSLNSGSTETGTITMSAVNIEENNDKEPVNYVMPPGITREQDPTQPQLVESNEQALCLIVEDMAAGEQHAVYKSTNLDLRPYKRLQMFVHANALSPNTYDLDDSELALFFRLGSDYQNNYYEYEIPLQLTAEGHYDRYSSSDCELVWPDENMLDIYLSLFTQIKKDRNTAKAEGLASYTTVYSAYDEDNPSNKVSIMGNPTLGEVKIMMIGIRNLSSKTKSGEIWCNELRLKEYESDGGWAAQGSLDLQLSDFGSVNISGKIVTEGFGGLEDGVSSRATDDYKTWSITTSLDLGKFFPDKAKVSIPFYYSVTKEKSTPKYNPMDTDMELDDALDAAGSEEERDSIERIAITRTTSTNFSLSNVRVGISTKRHPMPWDPANFTFSYSHSHDYTTGETTVYEKEDTWSGSINYSYTPVYKTWEPFKKKFAKNKSKWLDILRRFGLNWLPQNITFNTEMTRTYYELQERDMDDLSNSEEIPLSFSEQFLWNRSFSMRWDLTRNLHFDFSSATDAEIEEPYTPVNKDLYPTQYEAWKDSVWASIKDFGRPLEYNQEFNASYKLPLNLIPIFDWVTGDGSYNATYNWTRGSELDDGTSLGNTISNNRTYNINGAFDLVKLYNHFPFLKKANERFEKTRKTPSKNDRNKKKVEDKDLPKNRKSYEAEVTLRPDTVTEVNHGKNTKKLIVSAKNSEGKAMKIKWKTVDANKIKITTEVDTVTTIKLTVTPRQPAEEKKWYKTMQVIARGLMMVRSVSVSYKNQFSMSLPGFMPEIGDMLGQRTGDVMAPGLDFAFGFIDESYINKAYDNGWLLMDDSVATPATTSLTEDLQIKMTLEPIKNLKIDLNASRTQTKSRSIQYMYEGMPTTYSGTFTMTTISIGSAFESMGNATNGYPSATFEKFCNSLDAFQQRAEAQYTGAPYPESSTLAGQVFDPANGTIDKYSADVMIPAFLKAYTLSGDGLSFFPSLAKMLPNWSIKYSGLTVIPWFKERFKSINLTHTYKSVYAVGSYSSYSSFVEYIGDLGFVTDVTSGDPVPSSMFNVSTVSINESFSPLFGIDVTLKNNMTISLEYRKTRVLSLSITSVQLNETLSRDWVIGWGYKINNFKLFGSNKNKRKVKNKNSDDEEEEESNTSSKGGFNSDLNLSLDLSFRKQASITRDIATMTSSASSGSNAFKLSFSAEYTLSKYVTMSFYYDRQTNTPLLSSSSYPTTTQDFGLSLKVSLTQ